MHLIEFFDRGVTVNPHGTAFCRPDGADALTYLDVQEISHRVAGELAARGLGAGDAIAVLSPNDPMAFPIVLGVLRSGASWIALNARGSSGDIVDLLRATDARALLYLDRAIDLASEVATQVDTIEWLASFGSAQHAAPSWFAPPGTRVALPDHDPESLAALFATGGTTGKAKAVEVPHRAFETMIHGLNTCLHEPAPVHLVAAPITHAAGALVFPVLSVGGTNVIHDGVDPARIMSSIARDRVTRLFLPPTAIYSLLAHPSVADADLSSLRYFLYGAAPMSVDKLREALAVFGPVMAQFYGQVEAPMICAFLSPEDHRAALADESLAARLASCGRPTTVANVAVMDESGALCPPGMAGEVAVRSSLVMKGYREGTTRTPGPRLPGGWHATGDIGYFDVDGFLYIVDRKRDMIITGGFNVFPSEVEQTLWAHPAVKDCAVIGVPDPKWGERVTAVVELKVDARATSDELIALARNKLGSVKAPKEIVFRELPRSAVGKILKRELRDEYWAGQSRRV